MRAKIASLAQETARETRPGEVGRVSRAARASPRRPHLSQGARVPSPRRRLHHASLGNAGTGLAWATVGADGGAAPDTIGSSLWTAAIRRAGTLPVTPRRVRPVRVSVQSERPAPPPSQSTVPREPVAVTFWTNRSRSSNVPATVFDRDFFRREFPQKLQRFSEERESVPVRVVFSTVGGRDFDIHRMTFSDTGTTLFTREEKMIFLPYGAIEHIDVTVTQGRRVPGSRFPPTPMTGISGLFPGPDMQRPRRER